MNFGKMLRQKWNHTVGIRVFNQQQLSTIFYSTVANHIDTVVAAQESGILVLFLQKFSPVQVIPHCVPSLLGKSVFPFVSGNVEVVWLLVPVNRLGIQSSEKAVRYLFKIIHIPGNRRKAHSFCHFGVSHKSTFQVPVMVGFVVKVAVFQIEGIEQIDNLGIGFPLRCLLQGL